MTVLRVLGVGLVFAASLGMQQSSAQIRDSLQALFPRDGCSPGSRINPCQDRAPRAPAGDTATGPLTDALRDGPLDPPRGPLGSDAPEPSVRPLLLAPAHDRLGAGGRG